MAFNFGTSVLPTSDNTFSLGSASKRWKINDQEITFDTIYPIGAVYISVAECNPEQLFGGTWEQITGKFLLACDTTYTNGSTGGSATMSHTHTMMHTHTQVATTSGGPSTNTSGGNNNATAGPSNNTSGSTAITVAQMPSHNHGNSGAHKHDIEWPDGNPISLNSGSSSGYNIPWNSGRGSTLIRTRDLSGHGAHTHTSQGSGSGHTHTLSSHTHTMSSHTHTLSSHTHSTSATTTGEASNSTTSAASNDNNMPPYLAVYMYKRIA